MNPCASGSKSESVQSVPATTGDEVRIWLTMLLTSNAHRYSLTYPAGEHFERRADARAVVGCSRPFVHGLTSGVEVVEPFGPNVLTHRRRRQPLVGRKRHAFRRDSLIERRPTRGPQLPRERGKFRGPREKVLVVADVGGLNATETLLHTTTPVTLGLRRTPPKPPAPSPACRPPPSPRRPARRSRRRRSSASPPASPRPRRGRCYCC
jgi:hypothetical protein